MPARLVALDEGPDIPLARGPILVGRHPHCDVRLPSIRVSRRHCCLIAVDDEVAVRDLGSSNGTRINDRRVEAGRLQPGDTLSIANLRYRLKAGRVAEGSRLSPRADAPGVDSGTAGRSDDAPGTAMA